MKIKNSATLPALVCLAALLSAAVAEAQEDLSKQVCRGAALADLTPLLNQAYRDSMNRQNDLNYEAFHHNLAEEISKKLSNALASLNPELKQKFMALRLGRIDPSATSDVIRDIDDALARAFNASNEGSLLYCPPNSAMDLKDQSSLSDTGSDASQAGGSCVGEDGWQGHATPVGVTLSAPKVHYDKKNGVTFDFGTVGRTDRPSGSQMDWQFDAMNISRPGPVSYENLNGASVESALFSSNLFPKPNAVIQAGVESQLDQELKASHCLAPESGSTRISTEKMAQNKTNADEPLTIPEAHAILLEEVGKTNW